MVMAPNPSRQVKNKKTTVNFSFTSSFSVFLPQLLPSFVPFSTPQLPLPHLIWHDGQHLFGIGHPRAP